MLFTLIMNETPFNIFERLLTITVLILVLSCTNEPANDSSELVKVALRDTGNKLLLSNNDSTSLILPVVKLEKSKYQIRFSESLSFGPDTLVSILQESFKKAQLPQYYRVEVVQCTDGEVAYSYQMSAEDENTIVPCLSRYLPEACYNIEVKFTRNITGFNMYSFVPYVVLIFILSIFGFFRYRKTKSENIELENNSIEKLGSFYFYPEQNKLVKEAEEIALSKKECELLALFAANPNHIIKRDELTKRVWEDNGVFVGRSLDTYISKLRKKLASDKSIKLTNIHGVGYKLELNLKV